MWALSWENLSLEFADQVKNKPDFTATGGFEILDLEIWKIILSRQWKTKELSLPSSKADQGFFKGMKQAGFIITMLISTSL